MDNTEGTTAPVENTEAAIAPSDTPSEPVQNNEQQATEPSTQDSGQEQPAEAESGQSQELNNAFAALNKKRKEAYKSGYRAKEAEILEQQKYEAAYGTTPPPIPPPPTAGLDYGNNYNNQQLTLDQQAEQLADQKVQMRTVAAERELINNLRVDGKSEYDDWAEVVRPLDDEINVNHPNYLGHNFQKTVADLVSRGESKLVYKLAQDPALKYNVLAAKSNAERRKLLYGSSTPSVPQKVVKTAVPPVDPIKAPLTNTDKTGSWAARVKDMRKYANR